MHLVQPLEARRFFSAYAFDSSFGSDETNAGRLGIPSDGAPLIAVRDGRIVAAANYYDESRGPLDNVIRLHGDGTEDRSFKPVSDLPADQLTVVGVDSLARPMLNWPGLGRAGLTRYLPKGRIDKTFNGLLSPPDSAGKLVSVYHVEPQPGGTMLAVVTATTLMKQPEDRMTDLYLVRLNETTGQVDSTFANDGYLALGHSADAGEVQFQADGRGRVYLGIDGRSGVYRFRRDGSRDKAFADNGKITKFPDGGFTLDAAGNYLTWWANDSYNTLLRFDPAGRDDETFNANVSPRIDDGALDTFAVLPQPDGTLYVQTAGTLRKFKTDGAYDTAFDDDGVTELPSRGKVIAALPDGRFLQRIGNSVYGIAPVPTVSVDDNGTLHLSSGARGDSFTLRPGPSNGVNVFINGKAAGRFFGVARIWGDLGGGNDALDSSSLAIGVKLLAGGGNDTLVTGDGNDTLNGGDGNDLIRSNGARDVLDGGRDNDTINAGEGRDSITSQDWLTGDDVYDGGTGNDIINDDVGSNTMYGGEGNDYLAGGSDGNDYIDGGAGNDHLAGRDGNNTIVGGDGDDSIEGGLSDDTLLGSDGRDLLSGSYGDDSLSGGAGNDLLIAGSSETLVPTARNTLAGGSGTDAYRIESNADVLSGLETRLTTITDSDTAYWYDLRF